MWESHPKLHPRSSPLSQVLTKEELALAFRYFDKTGAGYVRVDDLRKLIDYLGLCLNHVAVKELCITVSVRGEEGAMVFCVWVGRG